MDFAITVTVSTDGQTGPLVAPMGLSTPHALAAGCTLEGGRADIVEEAGTGQPVLVITPDAAKVTLRYQFGPGATPYPETMFQHRDSRYTRAADALVAEARAVAPDASPLARARAIACDVAQKFSYGHPEARFNDGMDEIPALGCGLTEGSCVDINTYFVASLRAAGIEAGYVTGYFFPAEKVDHCNDMHCWVVTRAEGVVQEWDIAHHLKMGTREIGPALDPKPGFRAAVAHSMGLSFPELGIHDIKLIGEPAWAAPGAIGRSTSEIRLHHPQIAAA